VATQTVGVDVAERDVTENFLQIRKNTGGVQLENQPPAAYYFSGEGTVEVGTGSFMDCLTHKKRYFLDIVQAPNLFIASPLLLNEDVVCASSSSWQCRKCLTHLWAVFCVEMHNCRFGVLPWPARIQRIGASPVGHFVVAHLHTIPSTCGWAVTWRVRQGNQLQHP
jgi:hypothetical protein